VAALWSGPWLFIVERKRRTGNDWRGEKSFSLAPISLGIAWISGFLAAVTICIAILTAIDSSG